MRFRFDELEFEKKFRDRLDEYILGAVTVRPKSVDSELGLKIIILDKLVGQNNPDVIAIVVRQVTESMSRKIAELQATSSCILLVNPLQFDYIRGRFDANGKKLEDEGKTNATEVFITAKIEELE